MREAIEQLITELWARCSAHTDDYQDAECLFQKKRDEGSAEAYEWAANRLKAVLHETDHSRDTSKLE